MVTALESGVEGEKDGSESGLQAAVEARQGAKLHVKEREGASCKRRGKCQINQVSGARDGFIKRENCERAFTKLSKDPIHL